MDNKSFWLIDLDASVVSVSYIAHENGKFHVGAIGPTVEYEPDGESIAVAVDQSLSTAAESINLPESDEPNSVALILPPFWVGSDGKITPNELKLIEVLCKKQQFQPMGFISNDEAIVEEANHVDGFPASFVLVKLSPTEMTISLAYLGKVIERLKKPLPSGFDPVLLESALLEFKSESTLPPQILLYGQVLPEILEKVKNFPWIGKKNIETFLHFPEIKVYTAVELAGIYTQSITSQFSEVTPSPQTFSAPTDESVDNIEEIESTESNLVEVNPDDLGFTVSDSGQVTLADNFIPAPAVEPPQELFPEVEDIVIQPSSAPPIPKITKKIKLPHLNFPSKNIFLIPLGLSPILILLVFLFSKAKITLYLTPYTFQKQFSVVLDPQASAVDAAKKIIPVNVKSFDINSTASISTTGQKTVGDKSKGEVVVYNKTDKVQNIPQGSVLIDDKGNKYLLTQSASIASSSSNLDLGVITLGQTKVMVNAADIGPEYNLPKDTKLHFKDFPETSLIAKTNQELSGGAKRQINAVSAQDKINLEQKINAQITTSVDEKVKNEGSSITGIIKDSIQIKKGRADYSREVGEEADELTATAQSSVNVFYLDSSKKSQLISAFLSNDSGYSDSIINPDNFTLSLSAGKSNGNTLAGTITLEGSATPKLNQVALIKSVSGHRLPKAEEIIKKSVPRAYKYHLDTNLSFLNFINPLPYLLKNITVVVN